MGFDFGQFKNLTSMKEVWDKMPDKSWTGLIAAIKQTRGDKGSSESLDKAEVKAEQAQSQGYDFPNNPIELVKFLATH